MSAEWFKDRLREIRAAKGWTQAELAERAGMTREGVAQGEPGRREPAWASVVALANALGVGCDAFLHPPAAGTATPQERRPGRPRKTPIAGQTGDAPGGNPGGGKRRHKAH